MAELTEHELVYLRSIKRNLDELHQLSLLWTGQTGFTLGNEVLGDNRNWLDCFIDEHERKLLGKTATQ